MYQNGQNIECSAVRIGSRSWFAYLNATNIVLFVITTGCLLVALFLLWTRPLMADEGVHFEQISRFIKRNWTLNPETTTIPGYHFLMAVGATVLRVETFPGLRVIGTAFGMLAILLFFFCSRQFDPDSASRRTQQWMVQPLLFSFFFVLYTDMAALAFVLAAVLAFKWRRNLLAGVMGIISIAIRQQNIVWFVFLPVLYLVETLTGDGKLRVKTIFMEWRTMLRQTWIFLLGTGLFIAFVIWNGGIAIGDAPSHPFPVLYAGNPYLFLFVCFFLFLPLHLPTARRLLSLLTMKRTIWLLIGVSGFFLLYWITFTNTHPYNQARYQWWLHNKVVLFAVASRVHKALFFLPVVGGLLALIFMPLSRRSYALVYPFTFLAVAPSWLIEPRYYLVPLTLLILMRKQEHWLTEYVLLAYWLVLSMLLLAGLKHGEFFV